MEQFNKDELVNAFNAGEKKAFDQVHLRYYEPLYHRCFSLVRDEMAAEEIANDVLMKVWKHRKKVTTYSKLEALLFLNAKHLSLNHLRYQSIRKVKFIDELPEDWSSNMVSNPLFYNNVLQTIQDVIDGLDTEHQLIAKYLIFEKWTPKEIAEVVKKNEQTIRNIKADIWKMLIEALKKRDLPLLTLLMQVLQSTF